MSLPNIPQKDNYRREVRTEWGGINLNENAGDGELIEAMNMSSREYPLLANLRFYKYGEFSFPIFMPFSYDGDLYGIDKYGGETYPFTIHDPKHISVHRELKITGSQVKNVRYAIMQKKVYIIPSKQVFDLTTGTIADMESKFDSGSSTVVFKDGTIGGVPADGNTIYCSGANWANYFSVGDGVTISGSGLPENNKTPVIREIDGDYLRFSENCFTVESYWHLYLYESLPVGRYYFYTDSSTWYGFILDAAAPASVMLELRGNHIEYQVPGQAPVSLTTITGDTPSGTELTFLPPADADHVTISRTAPDMDFVCVNENRLWGCKGDTIYCSKQGDPLNWNVMPGISTDSWATETGTPGDFTGCCAFQGYPTFFKDDKVFRILGEEPRNFTLRRYNIVGVTHDNDMSIVEIRGKLYYSSSIGIVEWNGGDYPSVISTALSLDVNALISDPINDLDSIAGTDGIRYFIDLTYTDPDGIGRNRIMIYDTRFGTWHEMERVIPGAASDGTSHRVGFASSHSTFYMTRFRKVSNNQEVTDVFILSKPRFFTSMFIPDWRVTFADSTRAYKTALTGSESKKGVLRLLIRCKLAGTMKVWVAYDGGDFEEATEFGGDDGLPKTSKVVPLILRRCDYWQLRLTGTGDAVIYSIAVEKYGGEWQQA